MLLCFVAVGIAFILAVAVPIFSYLIGIVAALFASWYTYGVAGFLWIHDTYHLTGGRAALKRKWGQTILAVLTIAAGAFICVAGTFVSIKVSNICAVEAEFLWMTDRFFFQLIVEAYKDGLVGKPFTC